MKALQSHIKLRRLWLFAACIWALIIVVLMRLPTVQIPLASLMQYRFADKIAHGILFTVLSGLWLTALGRNLRMAIVVLIFGCLFGLLTEVIQMLVISRTSSLYDFIANCLGVMLGIVLALLYEGSKP